MKIYWAAATYVCHWNSTIGERSTLSLSFIAGYFQLFTWNQPDCDITKLLTAMVDPVWAKARNARAMSA